MDSSGLFGASMNFTPLDLVPISIGGLQVKVYPTITSVMSVVERAHAFQTTKTAIENLPVELRLIFDAFGSQLNASSTVDGIISGWRRHFDSHWIDFGNLSILSFHDSAGAIVANTTTAADPHVLLPVINGPRPASRAEDVRYVRLQCTLDFASLVTILPYPTSTVLRVAYYLELPQGIHIYYSHLVSHPHISLCPPFENPTL